VIPLIVTGNVRRRIAAGSSFEAANKRVLADLADGWTLMPVQRGRRTEEFVVLVGREHSYTASLPGYRLADEWCICPRSRFDECRCRDDPREGDCGAVKLTGCRPLTPFERIAALSGDRYAEPFELEETLRRSGALGWGSRWGPELSERWTRVHARVRRREEEDVLDLWNEVLEVRELVAASLAGPVPYEDVDVDEQGLMQFTLVDAQQRIAQGAVYQLPEQERLRLTVIDVEGGVVSCDPGDTDPHVVRDVADEQKGDRRRLVLDSRETRSSLRREQHTLTDLEARRTHNPDLLELVLEPRLAGVYDWLPLDETPIQDQLDEVQDDAVQRALRARDLLVVQGPPGTGKTTFIAELVLRHLRAHPGDTVLVASQTHHATDHLLRRVHALDADVPLVRVARPWQIDDKVAEDVRRFWLDAPVPFETAARSRAERYRRYSRARVTAGAWEEDAVEPLLAIQREYLGTDGLQPPRQRRLDEAAVVAGTCFGVSNDPDIRERAFGLAIVEEAGKATPTEALMAMLRAEKIVLVGDVRQLPPTPDRAVDEVLRHADRRPEQIADERLRKRAIRLVGKLEQARQEIESTADQPERYTAETLFAYVGRRLRAEHPQLELTLTRQYRMASGIGDLISACFYDGELENGYDDADVDPRAAAIPQTGAHVLLADVAGTESVPRRARGGKSRQNLKEAERAVRFLQRLEEKAAARPETDGGRRLSVAVITGYSAQAALLRSQIAPLKPPHLDVRVGLVDSFQGDEAEVVIVSLVRTERPGFMERRNRINVALSRARSLLIVLVSLPQARDGTLGRPLQDVVAFVDARRAEGDKRYELRNDKRAGTR
jgi:hypothetical protein